MKKGLVLALTLTIIVGELSFNYFQAEAKRLIDERAQALLQQARAAIGGENAINGVNNLSSTGKITRQLKTPDNQGRSLEGVVETALETNGKIHKKIKLTFQGEPNAVPAPNDDGKKIFDENDKTILFHRLTNGNIEPGQELRVNSEGNNEQRIVKRIDERRTDGRSEFSQLMLGLLLKSSPSLNLVYNYAGEENVDGTLADIIDATGGENFKTKLYLDKQTHLPLMISYRGITPHPIFMIHAKGGVPFGGQRDQNVIVFKTPDGEKSVENSSNNKVSVRQIDADGNQTDALAAAPPLPLKELEEGEIQIRFSDFRPVGNLMLPHKLTSYFNNQPDETTVIDSYEINAANLLDRFKDESKPLKNQ